ncbi:MAG TPA: DMT family transporter [Candidatus Baltobacteraceae bacterium]
MGTHTVPDKILAGLLAALGSAIFFGLNATATKVLYAPGTPSHIDPLGLVTARSLWTLPLFLLLALATRPRDALRPSRSDLAWFLLSGICYGPATTGMFALGVGHTSAAHAVLLLALAPVFASILAVIFLHERLHPVRIVAIMGGAIGACVLTFSRSASGSTPAGDAMILVMVFSWGVMALALRVLNRTYPALFVAGIMGALGSLILVAIGAANHRLDEGILPLRYYDLKTILAFDLELVVLLSIAGQVLQSLSIRILGVIPVAAITGYGSIFFGMVGSLGILHEQVNAWDFLAGALLLVALALALKPIGTHTAFAPESR